MAGTNLTTCAGCGKEISKTATACPGCGKKVGIGDYKAGIESATFRYCDKQPVMDIEGFLEKNSRKALLGFETSKLGKWYIFWAYVISCGGLLVLTAMMKKKQYHPFIFSAFGVNKLDAKQIEKVQKFLSSPIPQDETPLFAIIPDHMTTDDRILITDRAFYYHLRATKGAFETKTVSGRMPLDKITSIGTNSTFSDNLEIKLNNDAVGSLSDIKGYKDVDLFLRQVVRAFVSSR